MADFCVQCSEVFGMPGNDLAGLVRSGYTVGALCEGCGPTWVDEFGNCCDPAHRAGDKHLTDAEMSKRDADG